MGVFAIREIYTANIFKAAEPQRCQKHQQKQQTEVLFLRDVSHRHSTQPTRGISFPLLLLTKYEKIKTAIFSSCYASSFLYFHMAFYSYSVYLQRTCCLAYHHFFILWTHICFPFHSATAVAEVKELLLWFCLFCLPSSFSFCFFLLLLFFLAPLIHFYEVRNYFSQSTTYRCIKCTQQRHLRLYLASIWEQLQWAKKSCRESFFLPFSCRCYRFSYFCCFCCFWYFCAAVLSFAFYSEQRDKSSLQKTLWVLRQMKGGWERQEGWRRGSDVALWRESSTVSMFLYSMDLFLFSTASHVGNVPFLQLRCGAFV